MEIQTIQKNINITPRKLRLVADLVRGMKPVSALKTLDFTQNTASLPLAKAIKTVLANAKQKGLGEKDLTFKKLEINEGAGGRSNKRVRAAGRGFRRPYTKKTSQIKIVISNEKGKN